MGQEERISLALLLLRLSVFLVMSMWTLDKLVNPEHAAGVFANFYGLSGMQGAALTVIALLEAVVLVGFLLGYQKKYTYGAVLVFHAVSTLSSYRQYLDPWSHLLFFAAWPMLAACLTLYLLRDLDTRWALS